MSRARLAVQAITKLGEGLKTASTAKLGAIAKRLGIAVADAKPETILAKLNGNKLTAALVAYELYGLTDEVYGMFADDESALTMLNALAMGTPNDDGNTASDADLVDEYKAIRIAIQTFGLEKFLTLRKAFTVDAPTVNRFLQKQQEAREIGFLRG